MTRAVIFILCALLGAVSTASAQPFTALARLEASESRITTQGGAFQVELSLSQGVPYRVYTLTEPARLVLDFREVDFSGVDAKSLILNENPKTLRFGAVRPGWSRLVLDLPKPQVVSQAGLRVDESSGAAVLSVALQLTDPEEFQRRSGAPSDPEWDKLRPSVSPTVSSSDDKALTIVLDPGHGGIDPGAVSAGITEADLMFVLAQEVRDALLRSGDVNVVLTRQGEEFVSLERRVKIARAAEADLFVSFHADALASGKANGATVYTLSEEASDAASAALAERHNRADLLAGVDLSGQNDEIAAILMDLARLENKPRSEALARGIILGINTEVGHTYKRPIQSAGFSVLKAPDIPSVLIEVGFLSSKDDLTKLTDPIWRMKMVVGIHNGIQAWLLNDAADAQLRRK
ncbi:N-acetylmuramoyl-L-alanine amidase [Planktotalea sp.]|uniref:N-acetylmuramoyl-L-alanine amidase n=1 Tax=Planktotalea sp. TaxID=2029877 RepID=UPI0035C7D5AB